MIIRAVIASVFAAFIAIPAFAVDDSACPAGQIVVAFADGGHQCVVPNPPPASEPSVDIPCNDPEDDGSCE